MARKWKLLLIFLICFCVKGIQGDGAGCNRTVTCGFEGNQACGFSGDATWALHEHSRGSNGSYALFQWQLSSGGDMASPTLCNGEINVQFSCVVLLQHTELHVLTQCNDRDLSPQPVHGVAGPMTSWKRFNFSLPACPIGQIQQVVFRAVHAHITSQKIALDDVRIETTETHSTKHHVTNPLTTPDTSHVPTRCNDTVSCQFEGTDCGFRGSFNWRLEKSSTGGYERFEHNGGVTTTDLVSPMLCGNAEIYVEFSCNVIAPPVILGRRTELHVLVTCNDVELRNQPLHGIRGSRTSWKPVNFTLPACPKGQTPRIVFRAVYASTGSVILLDNVHLQSNAPTTTLVSTLSTKTIARHSHTTTKSSSQHGVVRSSTRPTATTSVLRESTTTTRPKFTTSTSPKSTTATSPRPTTSTRPTSTTSTSPTSTTSTRPISTTSTGPTSTASTYHKSTSTSPTAKTSTSPTATSSTHATSTTSTSLTSTTSTSLTSTTSTSPASTTPTSPTSKSSTRTTSTKPRSPTSITTTRPTSTMSTPKSTTSTGPTSTTSTPTSTTSTQPKSTTSTPKSTTSTPTSTASTQPKSTTSTPKSTTSTLTVTTSAQPKSTTSTATATASTQPAVTKSTHHIITATSTRPAGITATHSAMTKSPEHRPSTSQNPGGNEGTAGPQSGNGSDDKEKLTIGVAVGVCGAVLLLVVVVYIVYRRRHSPSDRQPLSSDYLDDEDLGMVDDKTIKMSQTLTDPNSDC